MVYWGIVKFCLLRRIGVLTIVCEPYWYDRLRTIDWTPQGPRSPFDHKDGAIIGLSFRMTKRALARTRAFYGVTKSVLWQSASFLGRRASRSSRENA